MMTKLSILTALVLATGCSVRSTSPAARQQAVTMFATGASCDQIASELQIDRDHARELIRTGMADLHRKFYNAR